MFKEERGLQESLLFYIDPSQIWGILSNQSPYILKARKCYPYEDIPLTLAQMKGRHVDGTYDFGYAKFSEAWVDIAINFFGNNSEFYYPKKAAPLLVTKKNSHFSILICPRINEIEGISFDTAEGFKYYTGCRCELMIEYYRNKEREEHDE